MWQKFGLAIELGFLRRQVNGYFVVHSTENGALWHNDMFMEQGWEMHFPVIWEPQNPRAKVRITMAFLKFERPGYLYQVVEKLFILARHIYFFAVSHQVSTFYEWNGGWHWEVHIYGFYYLVFLKGLRTC